MTIKIITGLTIAMTCSAMWASTANAQGNTMRIKQFIAPIECVEEVVDNGVTVTKILTPEECDEFLHPHPPDNGEEPSEPEGPSTPPDRPSKPVKPDKITAPNTGWLRVVNDAVYEAGIVPLVVIIGALFFVRKIRKFKR